MKNVLILLLLLNTYFGYAQNNMDVAFKEVNYGIISSRILLKQELPSSPTRNHLIMGPNRALVEETDSIPATLGTQFAVIYQLESPQEGVIPVNIIWKYPEGMIDTQGQGLSETSYVIEKNLNVEETSSYTLEAENELVKGIWTFQMVWENKLLYEREFYLY